MLQKDCFYLRRYNTATRDFFEVMIYGQDFVSFICEWSYENRTNTLHQITHMPHFTTSKDLKIDPKKEKIHREYQEKENKRGEEKRVTFLLVFVSFTLESRKE